MRVAATVVVAGRPGANGTTQTLTHLKVNIHGRQEPGEARAADSAVDDLTSMPTERLVCRRRCGG